MTHLKLAVVALAGAFAWQPFCLAGIDLGSSTSGTPYDRYMRPVRGVMSSTGSRDPSMEKVSALMRQGHEFRYSYRRPYVAASPSTTAARQAGDCKDKALWLAKQMNARNVRFVVGKSSRYSSRAHAWLLWKKGGEYYILDCTNGDRPMRASSVPRGRYIAQYSWSHGNTYRHAGASRQAGRVAQEGRARLSSLGR